MGKNIMVIIIIIGWLGLRWYSYAQETPIDETPQETVTKETTKKVESKSIVACGIGNFSFNMNSVIF
jgi:hypothetical protein